MQKRVKNDTTGRDGEPPEEASSTVLSKRTKAKARQGWLLEISKDDRRLIGKDVQKVDFRWPIGMPYCRPLGYGRWDVRSDLTGGRTARSLFCIVAHEMVLLHGFVKKTQKTPLQEIDLALKRKRELD